MSKVRTALIPVAATIVLTALGCSDPEPNTPDTILGPVTASAGTDVADLTSLATDTPGHLATDTAKVARRLAKRLRGALVDGKSIFRNGRLIGVLTNSRVRPGRRGNDGGGGGEADKHVPNPLAPPVGPQLETWCMVRIWYDLDTGEILDAEILYCWDDGDGNGSGGGGNNNNQNNTQVTFTLTCAPSVTRGSDGRCSVSAVGDDGEVDTVGFTFSWSSSTGASASGQRMDSWEGTATDDATVTVSVAGFTDSKDINVRPRSNWRTNEFGAVPSYSHALPDNVFGDHRINPSTPSIPSPTAGSGPWDGQYTAGRAPTVGNRIRIQANYTSAGPTHPKANSVCSTVSYNSNYYRVNTACGSWPNAMAWRDKVLVHERDHENEYNRCLRATSVMSQMEEVVGSSSSDVRRDMLAIWNNFYQNTLQALSPTYARGISTGSNVFWYYNSGWTDCPITVSAHGSRSNCF